MVLASDWLKIRIVPSQPADQSSRLFKDIIVSTFFKALKFVHSIKSGFICCNEGRNNNGLLFLSVQNVFTIYFANAFDFVLSYNFIPSVAFSLIWYVYN